MAPPGSVMDRLEENKQAEADVVTRHLIDAIEQVRLDMARVELWAYAVTGFSRPVPAYDPSKIKMWLPQEQAKPLEEVTNNPRDSAES